MVLLLQRGCLSAAQLEVSLILKCKCVYNLYLRLCLQKLQSLICQNLKNCPFLQHNIAKLANIVDFLHLWNLNKPHFNDLLNPKYKWCIPGPDWSGRTNSEKWQRILIHLLFLPGPVLPLGCLQSSYQHYYTEESRPPKFWERLTAAQDAKPGCSSRLCSLPFVRVWTTAFAIVCAAELIAALVYFVAATCASTLVGHRYVLQSHQTTARGMSLRKVSYEAFVFSVFSRNQEKTKPLTWWSVSSEALQSL